MTTSLCLASILLLQPLSQVDSRMTDGLIASTKGEYDKAISFFTAVIRDDPKNAEAYACRGNTHFFKKDYDQSIKDYSEAVRLDPKDAAHYRGRASAYGA